MIAFVSLQILASHVDRSLKMETRYISTTLSPGMLLTVVFGEGTDSVCGASANLGQSLLPEPLLLGIKESGITSAFSQSFIIVNRYICESIEQSKAFADLTAPLLQVGRL